jgi:hypothetical protein
LIEVLKVGVWPSHVQALALEVLKLCGGTTAAKGGGWSSIRGQRDRLVAKGLSSAENVVDAFQGPSSKTSQSGGASGTTQKKSFIADVLDNPNSLTELCCILKAGTRDNQTRALSVVEVFVRTPKLLSELLKRGVVMYLLGHCSSSEHGLSKQARELLKAMGNSPLHGLAVTEAMEQFLPAAVVAGVTADVTPATSGDSDEFSFTTDSRTPELIWNDDMALQFRQSVGEQLDMLHTKQLEDSSTLHMLDPDFRVQCVLMPFLTLAAETLTGSLACSIAWYQQVQCSQ